VGENASFRDDPEDDLRILEPPKKEGFYRRGNRYKIDPYNLVEPEIVHVPEAGGHS